MGSAADNVIAISATLIKNRLKEAGLETAEEIVKAAMVAARDESNTWLLGSEDDKIKAALVAAYPLLKDEDRSRLEQELSFFKALAAATSGVPVDFASVVAGVDEGLKPIGVKKLWDETGGK